MLGIQSVLLAVVLAASAQTDAPVYAVPPQCSIYFHDACSPAIGAWLPRMWGSDGENLDPKVATTSVHDEIVDPAGRGPSHFQGHHGIVGGTFFVYGMAGPPRGNLVYDAAKRIALYDEGCCTWHHVVVAANVPPPPKRVVDRSLDAVRTAAGVTLGASPQFVRTVFGAAAFRRVPAHADEATLAYQRPIRHPHASTCYEKYAFLFKADRLIVIDYGIAC